MMEDDSKNPSVLPNSDDEVKMRAEEQQPSTIAPQPYYTHTQEEDFGATMVEKKGAVVVDGVSLSGFSVNQIQKIEKVSPSLPALALKYKNNINEMTPLEEEEDEENEEEETVASNSEQTIPCLDNHNNDKDFVEEEEEEKKESETLLDANPPVEPIHNQSPQHLNSDKHLPGNQQEEFTFMGQPSRLSNNPLSAPEKRYNSPSISTDESSEEERAFAAAVAPAPSKDNTQLYTPAKYSTPRLDSSAPPSPMKQNNTSIIRTSMAYQVKMNSVRSIHPLDEHQVVQPPEDQVHIEAEQTWNPQGSSLQQNAQEDAIKNQPQTTNDTDQQDEGPLVLDWSSFRNENVPDCSDGSTMFQDDQSLSSYSSSSSSYSLMDNNYFNSFAGDRFATSKHFMGGSSMAAAPGGQSLTQSILSLAQNTNATAAPISNISLSTEVDNNDFAEAKPRSLLFQNMGRFRYDADNDDDDDDDNDADNDEDDDSDEDEDEDDDDVFDKTTAPNEASCGPSTSPPRSLILHNKMSHDKKNLDETDYIDDFDLTTNESMAMIKSASTGNFAQRQSVKRKPGKRKPAKRKTASTKTPVSSFVTSPGKGELRRQKSVPRNIHRRGHEDDDNSVESSASSTEYNNNEEGNNNVDEVTTSVGNFVPEERLQLQSANPTSRIFVSKSFSEGEEEEEESNHATYSWLRQNNIKANVNSDDNDDKTMENSASSTKNNYNEERNNNDNEVTESVGNFVSEERPQPQSANSTATPLSSIFMSKPVSEEEEEESNRASNYSWQRQNRVIENVNSNDNDDKMVRSFASSTKKNDNEESNSNNNDYEERINVDEVTVPVGDFVPEEKLQPVSQEDESNWPRNRITENVISDDNDDNMVRSFTSSTEKNDNEENNIEESNNNDNEESNNNEVTTPVDNFVPEEKLQPANPTATPLSSSIFVSKPVSQEDESNRPRNRITENVISDDNDDNDNDDKMVRSFTSSTEKNDNEESNSNADEIMTSETEEKELLQERSFSSVSDASVPEKEEESNLSSTESCLLNESNREENINSDNDDDILEEATARDTLNHNNVESTNIHDDDDNDAKSSKIEEVSKPSTITDTFQSKGSSTSPLQRQNADSANNNDNDAIEESTTNNTTTSTNSNNDDRIWRRRISNDDNNNNIKPLSFLQRQQQNLDGNNRKRIGWRIKAAFQDIKQTCSMIDDIQGQHVVDTSTASIAKQTGKMFSAVLPSPPK